MSAEATQSPGTPAAADRPKAPSAPAASSAGAERGLAFLRPSVRMAPLGLLVALGLVQLDLTAALGSTLLPGAPHQVVHGWREVDRHRAMQPLADDSQRVLYVGACQVAGFECHYGDNGRQNEGLCSTPHILENALRQDGQRVEIDNLGMQGVGYLPMVYLILETLDAPNTSVVIQSLAQGGIYYFNGIDWLDAQTCALGQQLRRRLDRLVERYPDIEEARLFRDYVAGLRPCLEPTQAAWLDRWGENSAWLSRAVYRWIDHLTRYPVHSKTTSVDTALAGFVEKKKTFGRFAPENVKLDPHDVWMFRMIAKVLAAQGKRYVLENPPDLGTQIDPQVQSRFWQPLTAALADLDNVSFVDLGNLPVAHGRDLYDHVSRTYYGNLKVAEALKPRLEELLREPQTPTPRR